MKKIRQNGFVLIIVITSMAAVGVEMFVLTSGANAIALQADNAYLEAIERNMTASALTWARVNVKNENIKGFNSPIELNLADMNIKRATLSISVGKIENGKAEVRVKASCSRGRRTLRHKAKYSIRL